MPLMSRTGGITGGLFVGAIQPAGWQDGDIWIDTSTTPYVQYINNAGTAKNIGIVVGGSTVLGIEVGIGA